MELFEDSLVELPFYSNEFNSPSDQFGVGVAIPNPWQDLQGFVKLTMLQGAMTVEDIKITAGRADGKFSDTFPVNQLLNEGNNFVLEFVTLPFVEAGSFGGGARVSLAASIPVRALYVAADDVLFTGTSVSRADTGGCLSPFAQAFSGVPAEKIVDDLLEAFPPTYSLEPVELSLPRGLPSPRPR